MEDNKIVLKREVCEVREIELRIRGLQMCTGCEEGPCYTANAQHGFLRCAAGCLYLDQDEKAEWVPVEIKGDD